MASSQLILQLLLLEGLTDSALITYTKYAVGIQEYFHESLVKLKRNPLATESI